MDKRKGMVGLHTMAVKHALFLLPTDGKAATELWFQ
jgi:hypothetical protein